MPTPAQNCMHYEISLAVLFAFHSNDGVASEHG